MAKSIVVASGKGGVGKTSVAVNLGLAVGICALVYLFFTGIFGIQLPRWGE